MSEPMTATNKDWKSAVRHVVFPLISGAVVAALQTAQSGRFDYHEMKGAAIVATLSGVIRFFQRFVTDVPDGVH